MVQSEEMKVRVVVGAESAYACITVPGKSLDVRLSAGRSAAQSLRESAVDLRAEAARLVARADLIEAAAQLA